MNKKVMLFSRDPGGANTVAPLYEKLIKRGYNVALYGKDAALNIYSKYGLVGKDICSILKRISKEEIYEFLSNELPDFLITGTSADDFTEKYLWNAAEKINVKSFAILDHWVNYGIRFSEFDLSDIQKYNTHKKHSYLPYKILVMDNYAKSEMINDGINKEKIIVTGQPYFDYLIQKRDDINEKRIMELKNSLFKGNESTLLTFVSEPISKVYNEFDESEHYLGYTEKTIFKQFYRTLDKIAAEYRLNINLVIRLHPKENRDSYNDIIRGIRSKYISCVVDSESDGFNLICASDFICGMTSMFLIESAIVEKPILSMQIGLNSKNSFILDKLGIVKSILSENELEENLKKALLYKNTKQYIFKIEKGAIEKILEYMEEIICQY